MHPIGPRIELHKLHCHCHIRGTKCSVIRACRSSVLSKSCPAAYAEGKTSNIVVMGEKGRAQLVRVERNKILATMNDVNKLRITFAQVTILSQDEALHDACCS